MRTSTPQSRPTWMDQLLINLPIQLFYMGDQSDGRNQRYTVMRVIAGKYRTRPLDSVRGMNIRPTSDRLRETLFNVLTAGNPAALEGSVWIDLFAGTGAVGIEALSRGAKQVYFVDSATAAAELIQKNLHSLELTSGVKVLQDDLPRAFWRMEREHVAADVVLDRKSTRLNSSHVAI